MITYSEIQSTLKRRIKILVISFQIGLIVSGLTAFFIPGCVYLGTLIGQHLNLPFSNWLLQVHQDTQCISLNHSSFLYGTDWLAFAHLLFAVLFIQVIRNPTRNKWVVEFGLIACALIIPAAMIMGYARNIPIGWRFIDCSFGIIGAALLAPVLHFINQLEKLHIKCGDTAPVA